MLYHNTAQVNNIVHTRHYTYCCNWCYSPSQQYSTSTLVYLLLQMECFKSSRQQLTNQSSRAKHRAKSKSVVRPRQYTYCCKWNVLNLPANNQYVGLTNQSSRTYTICKMIQPKSIVQYVHISIPTVATGDTAQVNSIVRPRQYTYCCNQYVGLTNQSSRARHRAKSIVQYVHISIHTVATAIF